MVLETSGKPVGREEPRRSEPLTGRWLLLGAALRWSNARERTRLKVGGRGVWTGVTRGAVRVYTAFRLPQPPARCPRLHGAQPPAVPRALSASTRCGGGTSLAVQGLGLHAASTARGTGSLPESEWLSTSASVVFHFP